jgi:hypothetical protein
MVAPAPKVITSHGLLLVIQLSIFIVYATLAQTDCKWYESCNIGRNVSVPFCGACLTGYR